MDQKKQSIRTEILKKRDLLAEAKIRTNSHCITETIRKTRSYRQCQFLLVFAGYRTEVSTYELIEDALQNGKRVFCPRVLQKSEQNRFGNRMEMIEITSLSCLQPGFHGIPEPVGTVSFEQEYTRTDREEHQEQVLMIMPGAVFDLLGHRIGYGKGFYDVYLKEWMDKGVSFGKIAVCHDLQIVNEELPHSEWDQRPDAVVTEERTLIFNGGNQL